MPVTQADRTLLGAYFCDQIIAIRGRRRLVEEKWLQSRRSWMNFNPGHYNVGDTGPPKYNIPSGRRVLERVIVRCVKLLTPSVKWHEVAPLGEYDQQKLSNIDKYMTYVLRKRIKSRSIISQIIRCMILYGRPVLKTSVSVVNSQVWPSWRAVDPFAFYTFPETAPTIEECDIIFEDCLFSWEKYQTYVKMGLVDELNQDDLTKPDWPYHLTERLAYQGITIPGNDMDAAIRRVDGELQKTGTRFLSCTEVWLTKEDKLYQAYIVWNIKDHPRIVGFYQSQYDAPLYRTAIHRPLPGETYTNAQAEDIRDLDQIQNDLINQFIQATDFEAGFGAVDIQQNPRQDHLKIKPRELMEFNGDPREILQFINPPNTSTNSLRAFQIALGIMNSIGGNGTLSEGVPGRNMPRAGFAAQSLIDLGMADNQDVSEVVEQEILTPALSDVYKVSSLFIPESQLMRIPGGQAFAAGFSNNILRKQDIMSDVEFEWVGSLQFADESQRAQRLMIFANLLAQPQLQQQLAQQGYVVNWSELIPMIWRYGLGERGLDRVLVRQQQPMASPPPPQQSGSPTGLNIPQPSVTNGVR